MFGSDSGIANLYAISPPIVLINRDVIEILMFKFENQYMEGSGKGQNIRPQCGKTFWNKLGERRGHFYCSSSSPILLSDIHQIGTLGTVKRLVVHFTAASGLFLLNVIIGRN